MLTRFQIVYYVLNQIWSSWHLITCRFFRFSSFSTPSLSFCFWTERCFNIAFRLIIIKRDYWLVLVMTNALNLCSNNYICDFDVVRRRKKLVFTIGEEFILTLYACYKFKKERYKKLWRNLLCILVYNYFLVNTGDLRLIT